MAGVAEESVAKVLAAHRPVTRPEVKGIHCSNWPCQEFSTDTMMGFLRHQAAVIVESTD